MAAKEKKCVDEKIIIVPYWNKTVYQWKVESEGRKNGEIGNEEKEDEVGGAMFGLYLMGTVAQGSLWCSWGMASRMVE